MPRKTREVGEIKTSFVQRLFKTEVTEFFEEGGDLNDLSLQELEEVLGDLETLKTDLGAISRCLMGEIRKKIREEGKTKAIKKINFKRKEVQ